jgi:hypothetical protein
VHSYMRLKESHKRVGSFVASHLGIGCLQPREGLLFHREVGLHVTMGPEVGPPLNIDGKTMSRFSISYFATGRATSA